MDIIEQAASMGWDLEHYIERKELAILNAGDLLSSLPGSGKERQIDVQKAIGDLAGFVNQIGAERMVLDPAGPFVLLRDTADPHPGSDPPVDQAIALSMKTTNILTSYAVPRTGERSMHGIEEYLVAGAIVLEMIWQDKALARSLIVEKMRCTDVKPTQLEFDIIKGQGIVIRRPTRSRS